MVRGVGDVHTGVALNYVELKNNLYRAHVKHIPFFFFPLDVALWRGRSFICEFSLKMTHINALKELKLKKKVDLPNFLESSNQRKASEKFGVSKTIVEQHFKKTQKSIWKDIFPKAGYSKENAKTVVSTLWTKRRFVGVKRWDQSM